MYLKKEEHAMNDDRTYRLGLSDLLEQDLSSYEYYNSLPKEVQDRIAAGLLYTSPSPRDRG